MKRSSILPLVLLILSVTGNSFSQKQKCETLAEIYSATATFERKGDVLIVRDRDYKEMISVETRKALIDKKAVSKCDILQFQFNYFDDKPGVSEEISLSFESISNKFNYDAEEDRKLIILADRKELFVSSVKQKSRDELSRNLKREYLSMEDDVTVSLVKKLAEAKNITFELGKRTFYLTPRQHRAISDFYTEVIKFVRNDTAPK